MVGVGLFVRFGGVRGGCGDGASGGGEEVGGGVLEAVGSHVGVGDVAEDDDLAVEVFGMGGQIEGLACVFVGLR